MTDKVNAAVDLDFLRGHGFDDAADEIERLRAALIWCSGSDDFQEGGKARDGWLNLCAPLVHEAPEPPLISYDGSLTAEWTGEPKTSDESDTEKKP